MTLFLNALGAFAIGYAVVLAVLLVGLLLWTGRLNKRMAREDKAKAVRRARAARRYEVLVGQIGGGRWN